MTPDRRTARPTRSRVPHPPQRRCLARHGPVHREYRCLRGDDGLAGARLDGPALGPLLGHHTRHLPLELVVAVMDEVAFTTAGATGTFLGEMFMDTGEGELEDRQCLQVPADTALLLHDISRGGAGSDISTISGPGPLETLPAASRPCDYGAGHICLYVDDIDAVYARLTGLGFRARSDGVVDITEGPNRGTRSIYMLDPDGYRAELLQKPLEA